MKSASGMEPLPEMGKSLSALWSAAQSVEEASQELPADLNSFVSSLQGPLQEWAGLFSQVPSDHKRRKEALAGALKIKSATKRFEKVATQLAAPSARNAEGAEEAAAAASCEVPPETEQLVECQASLREAVHGLLEVSFPVEEHLTNEDFKDPAAVDAAIARMRQVVGEVAALATLFRAAGLNAQATAGKSHEVEPSLAPEIMKMLEGKTKKSKNKKGGGPVGVEVPSADTNALQAAWEQSLDGRCSCLLGAEVWEGACWRRGIFFFSYISSLLPTQPGEGESADAGECVQSQEPGDAAVPLASRAMFSEGMRSFWMMLNAQGPIPGNHEDPALWKLNTDGPHTDETARLFYHGVYSSSHLRGLKYMCELSYWQWKYLGKSKADAELAALLNKKFVHVVRQIMPAAGWTADVEYRRILEMEEKRLACQSFSAGLDDRPATSNNSAKKGAVRSNGGYEADACPKPLEDDQPRPTTGGNNGQRRKKASQKK